MIRRHVTKRNDRHSLLAFNRERILGVAREAAQNGAFNSADGVLERVALFMRGLFRHTAEGRALHGGVLDGWWIADLGLNEKGLPLLR